MMIENLTAAGYQIEEKKDLINVRELTIETMNGKQTRVWKLIRVLRFPVNETVVETLLERKK